MEYCHSTPSTKLKFRSGSPNFFPSIPRVFYVNHMNMKNRRNRGWVLQITSVLALFLQWQVVQSITLTDEYKTPPPYALSPTYLQYLANEERKIYNAMKVYEEELQERLNLIKKYLGDYETSTIAGTFHLDSEDERDKLVVHHPILAFRMLSRFANEFDAVDRHISVGAEDVVFDVLFEAKTKGDLPTTSEVEDAVQAILRMQFMYALPSAQIANGQIPGGETIPVNLTTDQCYDISKNAQTTHYYTLALEWFDEIKRRMKDDPDPTKDIYYYRFTEESLDQDMWGLIAEHNKMFEEQFDDGHSSLYSEPVKSLVVGPRPSSTMRHDVVSRYSTMVANKSHPNYPEIIYARNIALCNGQNIRPPKDQSKLKCWLDHRRNPYWTILPLKIELINHSPQVIQIHDIISDPWTDELKKVAYPELEKAAFGPEDTYRTAGYAWFKDEDIPNIPLSRKLELVTGLNVRGPTAADTLQMAAYVFGGHVELHCDRKGPDDYEEGEDPKGNRVLTFLFYLNDVEKGGLTSFPELGFYVKPEKGSALLWNTNKRDGSVDELMLHGACPVLYGEKWIGTKWIYSNENVFTRPCGLKQDD